ncbi:putative membrane protein [Antricoccus suffuscus]|uniref:Putative membrane protein n=1 Tax=Antricoccus suffuscus TaxID=1629062 RepID=A0A2T0ZXF6_9ACTN|nr:DUF1003 domain-containing protein [Antricoccus suffuscus]PRZ41045.1 putative membrane protein [Antricoccus suffuscus]
MAEGNDEPRTRRGRARGQARVDRLDSPKGAKRRIRIGIDNELIGQVSESIARFMGTGRFLLIQTVIVVSWILYNVVAVGSAKFDVYPFILLNLAFSTQAAYAAPLILLAQNRQEARDRVALEEDRSRAVASKADTEFLARELAALRLAIGELATRDFVRSELARLAVPETDGDRDRERKPSKDSKKTKG